MEDKKIDESWKDKVAKEKEAVDNEKEKCVPEPDFKFFITTLAMQATIALGEVPNPVTNKQEKELHQAKFIIDVLGVLKDKTKGNLDKEEEKLLEDLLYGLRLSYVNNSKEKAK
jgi:hypothetical protein